MVSTAAKPVPLSVSRARRIWLHAQRLDDAGAVRRRAGGDAGRDRASRLRADRHHQRHRALPPPHPLHPHSRLSPRRPAPGADRRQDGVRVLDARALLRADRATCASTSAPCGATGQRRSTLVRRRSPSRTCARCCAHPQATGALTIRDIDDDVLVEKDHPWASRKPSKRALQVAFFRGLRHRQPAHRHAQDLRADRAAISAGTSAPRAATEREVVDYLLDRALRAQGIVSLDSICYLDAAPQAGRAAR